MFHNSQDEEGKKLNFVAVSVDELFDIRQNGKEGTIYALEVSRNQWNQYEKYNERFRFRDRNWKNMKIFKEDYLSQSSAIFVNNDNLVYDQLNKFILEVHQHGILVYYESLHNAPKVPKEEDPPQVLTMYMLSAGFIVWLVTVLIACLTFIGELIYFRFKRNLTSSKIIKIRKKKNEIKKKKKNERISKLLKFENVQNLVNLIEINLNKS
jgi:hypothetical protein